jgi:hypothetical protein
VALASYVHGGASWRYGKGRTLLLKAAQALWRPCPPPAPDNRRTITHFRRCEEARPWVHHTAEPPGSAGGATVKHRTVRQLRTVLLVPH